MRGLTLEEAVDKMRGPVDTSIELTLIRDGATQPIKVKITRQIVKVRAVRSHIEGGDVGYLRGEADTSTELHQWIRDNYFSFREFELRLMLQSG